MENIFNWRKPFELEGQRSWKNRLWKLDILRSFYLTYQINPIAIPSHFSVKCVMLLEALQMISLITSGDKMMAFNSGFGSVIKSVVQFTNFEHLQRSLGLAFTGPLVACLLTVQISVYAMSGMIVGSKYSSNNYTEDFAIVNQKKAQFISLYSYLFVPILVLPIFTTNFSILICSSSSPYLWTTDASTGERIPPQCFRGQHIIYFIFALLSLLISFLHGLWIVLFNKHMNPFAKDPRTCYSRTPKLLSFVSKFTACMLLPVQQVYPAYILGLPLACQIVLQLALHCYLYHDVNQFHAMCTAAVVWTIVANILQVALGNDDDNPYYYWTGLLIICSFTAALASKLEANVFEAGWNTSWKASRVLVRLIEVVEAWRQGNNQNRLDEFIARLNNKSPTYRKFMMDDSAMFDHNNRGRVIDEELAEIEDDIRHYEFVQQFCRDLMARFPKNLTLPMISCYIQRERLKNNYTAFYLAHTIQALDPGPYFESECYSLTKSIEGDFFREDKVFAEHNGMNVTQIVSFHSLLGKFKKDLEKIGSMFLKFWEELESGTPTITHLLEISGFLGTSTRELALDFDKLRQISPNNIKTLRYYGNFKAKIQMNELESRKFLEQASHNSRNLALTKNHIDDMRFKYGENTDAAMICASANLEDFGTITSASQELVDVLGYEPHEFKGRHVNSIIPKSLSEIHTNIMQNYFLTGVSHFVNLERLIFPEKSNGFIAPANGLLRIMPNLFKGLEMVVFMRPSIEDALSNQHILITDHTGMLVGVGNGMFDSFGILPNACYGKGRDERAIFFGMLLPELDKSNLDFMQPGESIKTCLDTTLLRSRYYNTIDAYDINKDQRADDLNKSLKNDQKIDNNSMVFDHQALAHMLEDIIEDSNMDKYKAYTVEITLYEVHVIGKIRQWRIYLVNKPRLGIKIESARGTFTSQIDEGSEYFKPEIIPMSQVIKSGNSIVDPDDRTPLNQFLQNPLKQASTVENNILRPKDRVSKTINKRDSRISSHNNYLGRETDHLSSSFAIKYNDMSNITIQATQSKYQSLDGIRDTKNFLSKRNVPRVIYSMGKIY